MTKDEQRRQEIFEKESTRFLSEGFAADDITTSTASANLIGPLIGCVLCIPFVIVYLIRDLHAFEDIDPGWFMLATLAGIVCIVIHELLHGLTWSLFTKNGFKSVAFGFIVQYLTPYCSCKEALKRGAYIAGLLMPCIILGLIPMTVACVIMNVYVLIFGLMMTITAGGDLMILTMIIKAKRAKNEYFLDHPTKIGLVRFSKDG